MTRFQSFRNRLVYVLLATPALIPVAMIVFAVNEYTYEATFAFFLGGFLLLTIAVFPPVHRFERYLCMRLFGTTIGKTRGGTAVRRVAFFTLLHLLAGASLGIAFGMFLIFVSEVSSYSIASIFDNGMTAADIAFLYGQALFSTATRALAVAILLASFVYVIGYFFSVDRIASWLLGQTAEEKLELSEAERKRLEIQNEMARDIHDSLGHALTIASLQAESGRAKLTEDPAGTDQALQTILSVCQRSQADLDDVLRILRSGDSTTSTQVRDLSSMSELVDEATRAGLCVSLDHPSGYEFSPEQSRALYRIVQECLTNALRYADPKTINLGISVTADGVVHFLADNPVLQGTTGEPVAGRGLQGIRARSELLGGSSHARYSNGRFVLDGRFPAVPQATTQGSASDLEPVR